MIPEDLMKKYNYGYVHSCELLNEPVVKDLIESLQEQKKKFKKVINDIKDLEIYHQNGGAYIIPVEVMNDIFGEIEDSEV